MKGGGELAQKKMGRPKKENPMNYLVRTYVDAAMNAEILMYCEEHNIERTELVRRAVRQYIDKKEQQKREPHDQ